MESCVFANAPIWESADSQYCRGFLCKHMGVYRIVLKEEEIGVKSSNL